MRVDAFFVLRSNGNSRKFRGEPEDFPWILPESDTYQVGMDQSSSCTGIYITNPKTSFHLIMHVTKTKEGFDEFFGRIRKMLMFIFQKSKLDLFVREDPIPQQRDRASQVLWQLVKLIDLWRDKRPEVGIRAFSELRGDKFGNIVPGTWRKHVVDKSKGTHRSTVKMEIAIDILDKYPELRPYFDIVPRSSDYDGFEALGILYGYKEEHKLITTENGTVSTVIAGLKDYTGHIQLYYRFFNAGQESSMDFVGYFKELFEDGNRDFLVYEPNPDKTFYDNTRVAASKHEVSTLIFKDPTTIRTLLMLTGNRELCDRVIVYIIRNNVLSSRLKKVLDGEYKGEFQTW